MRWPLVLLVTVAGASVLAASAPAAPARPIDTAIYLPQTSADATTTVYDHELDLVGRTGARFLRLTVLWPLVAPARRPTGWDATDPADPNYRWGMLDEHVRRASARGLEVYLTVIGAPTWAQAAPAPEHISTAHRPDPRAFGDFARAIARRYSGSFEGLPRVRHFQALNEPNLGAYLVPQLFKGRPAAPALYRTLLNSFAAGVRSVHRDNVVVAGGLAPFRDRTPDTFDQNPKWGPLTFMRELFCLSRSLRRTCNAKVDLDVWAHHPYTSGGPTHRANNADDVSLGDLPEMRRVLDAAYRGRAITRSAMPAFWVTEFSWDTAPPDPKGVPSALHARWVAEAIYRMWQSRVSLVTWYFVRDQPLSEGYAQSGLFYRGATPAQDRAKPALGAFRFPFVAFRERTQTFVWGRTPDSKRATVQLQQKFKGGWASIGRLKADRFGIFSGRVRGLGAKGSVRATLVGRRGTAVPFSLTRPRDRRVCPFGTC